MHDKGEQSQVTIEIAGMGLRKIRIANLPPEFSGCMLKANLAKYGEVRAITEEQGVKWNMDNTDAPQTPPAIHLTITGNRVLVSYEGQPATCYGCNATEHQYHDCPRRKRVAPDDTPPAPTILAYIVFQQDRITRITEAQQALEKQHEPSIFSTLAINLSLSKILKSRSMMFVPAWNGRRRLLAVRLFCRSCAQAGMFFRVPLPPPTAVRPPHRTENEACCVYLNAAVKQPSVRSRPQQNVTLQRPLRQKTALAR